MTILLTADIQYRKNGEVHTLPAGARVKVSTEKAQQIIAAGKARQITKPFQVPDACYECTDFNCHECPHGCKVPLIIGKQYPAEHVFH